MDGKYKYVYLYLLKPVNLFNLKRGSTFVLSAWKHLLKPWKSVVQDIASTFRTPVASEEYSAAE